MEVGMTRRATAIRCSFLATLLCLLAAGRAQAQSCANDIDCPTSACGGQVCDFYTAPTQTCKAAGTQPAGMDGWCTSTADCKCASLGAVCTSSSSCSFTKPPSGGGGNGGNGGAAGSTGAAGSSASGTAGAGAGGAAAAGNAGTSGGTSGGGSGVGSSSGCSVAGSPGPAGWLGFSVLAGLVVSRRR